MSEVKVPRTTEPQIKFGNQGKQTKKAGFFTKKPKKVILLGEGNKTLKPGGFFSQKQKSKWESRRAFLGQKISLASNNQAKFELIKAALPDSELNNFLKGKRLFGDTRYTIKNNTLRQIIRNKKSEDNLELALKAAAQKIKNRSEGLNPGKPLLRAYQQNVVNKPDTIYGMGSGTQLHRVPLYISMSAVKKPQNKLYEEVTHPPGRRANLYRIQAGQTSPASAPPPLPQKTKQQNVGPSEKTYSTPKPLQYLAKQIVEEYLKKDLDLYGDNYTSMLGIGETAKERITNLNKELVKLDTERANLNTTSPEYRLKGLVITEFNKVMKDNITAGYKFYKEIANNASNKYTAQEKADAKSEMIKLYKLAKQYSLNLN